MFTKKSFHLAALLTSALLLSACATTSLPLPATPTTPAIPTPTEPATPVTPAATTLEYKNTDYGFTFDLPISWQGYSILTETWEGNSVDNSAEKFSGPKLLIRNPLWSEANPYQDIPILVLAHTQWELIQQEKLAIGAAPIPPSKLGENAKYVFALPARYNFAFPMGFEEVEKNLEGNPLKGF